MKKILIPFTLFLLLLAILSWIGRFSVRASGLDENTDELIDIFADSLKQEKCREKDSCKFFEGDVFSGYTKKCFDEECRFIYSLTVANSMDSDVVSEIIRFDTDSEKVYDIRRGYCFPLDGAECDSIFFETVKKNTTDSVIVFSKYSYETAFKKNLLSEKRVCLKKCLAYMPNSIEYPLPIYRIFDLCDDCSEEVPVTEADLKKMDSLQKKMFFVRRYPNGIIEHGYIEGEANDTLYYSFYRDGRIHIDGEYESNFRHNGSPIYRDRSIPFLDGKLSLFKLNNSNKWVLEFNRGYPFARLQKVHYVFMPNKKLIQQTEDEIGFFTCSHKDVVFYPNGKVKRETYYDDLSIKFFFDVLQKKESCPKPKYIREYSKVGILIREKKNFTDSCYTGLNWIEEIKQRRKETISR